MEKQNRYIGNRLIVEFMGYTFYHKGVDIDWSDIGGLYERKEVFSKVPILVGEYPSDDQYYFSDVPNPDFQKTGKTAWRNDKEKLCWSTINYDKYLTDLDYDSNWNSLMPVITKIKELKYTVYIYQSHIQNTVEIFKLAEGGRDYSIVREASTTIPPIELLWKAIVGFIKYYNELEK